MKDNKMFKEFIPKMLADVIGHDMMKHGDFDIHLPKGTLVQVLVLHIHDGCFITTRQRSDEGYVFSFVCLSLSTRGVVPVQDPSPSPVQGSSPSPTPCIEGDSPQ